MKRSLFNSSLFAASLFTLLLAALTTAPALAHQGHDEAAPKVAPNTIALGLGGYSPVSYFTQSKPHFGSPRFQATHEGVTYLFADAKEKAAFEKNPGKYVPAYGGWCAYGMAVEGQFPADPTNYKIVEGKLMVFLKNEEVDTLEVWNQGDEAQLHAKADAYYAKLAE